MQRGMMDSTEREPGTNGRFTNRRSFLKGFASLGVGACATQPLSGAARRIGWNAHNKTPANPPLDFRSMAKDFSTYVMDPAHQLIRRGKDGRQFFVSALESLEDGGLTAYGAIAMGQELHGHGLEELAASMMGYYSEPYGLFLDGPGATLCEYWYLMNITAMAYGLVQLRFGKDPQWLARVERSAARLKEMAQQIKYDFNDQGYDFSKASTFTNKDIYRQPDAVGGYSYVMLLAWRLTGKAFCLEEAKLGMDRYLAFAANPWYEVPSGAMAVMAAAQLEALGHPVDTKKALGFVLDSNVGLMASGRWGGREVDGLMAGFRTEPAGQAYSMESMVTLPYIIPAVRFRPDLAGTIARYALNVASNLRWFYPEYLPRENQSRPDLPSMVPYERLSREAKGKSPYAEGDYAGHRSVYGGAYVMWLDAMVQPQDDPRVLRWDLTKTNFLDRDLAPAYLYYNPLSTEKRVKIELGTGSQANDLTSKRSLKPLGGRIEIALMPGETRVIEILP